MKRVRPFLLLTLLLATTMGVGPCGDESLGNADVDANLPGDGGGAGTIACDDGTGATDCCADDTLVGMCSNEGLNCWTRCSFQPDTPNEGLRGHKVCGGGQWWVGHGLFPCSRMAADGGSPDTAGPSCTPGADQTCNDDPTISSFWGHCEPTGVCTCHAGRALNPATGRCRLAP